MRGGAGIGGCVVLVVGLAAGGAFAQGAPAAGATFSCFGEPATIVGTTGDDVLVGTDGADVIVGRAGDDTIRGLGGDDLLCGSAGDDVLDGGPGADRVSGAAGTDQCWSGERASGCESELVPRPLPLNSYNLADLGVTDVDGDGVLDVFGLNHNTAGSVLLATGAGGYVDEAAALGLAQDPEFPGVEDRATLPRVTRAGLHVLVVGKRVRLQVVGAQGTAPATGTLVLFGTTGVDEAVGATYDVAETTRPNGLVESRVEFEIGPGGRLVLDPYYLGGPVSLAVTAPSRVARIHVGALGVHPSSTTFGFELRDRHGAAWLRGDSGGLQEAAVVRGGLHGQMALFDGVRRDEYLVDAGGHYADVSAERTLVKDSCSSRQTAWVDADHDGRPDLYVACEFEQGNRLHRRNPDGTFTEVASSLGLALSSAGPFRWVDLDGDGTSELVTATDDGVLVTDDVAGHYTSRLVTGRVVGANALTAADVDADGDLDLLLATRRTSQLLRNDAGTLTAVPATSLGLPAGLLAATFVDQDNDGRIDVDASPGGLFRQSADGTFAPAAVVPPDEGTAYDALTSWFDADGDGDRDRLHAVLPTPNSVAQQWVATLLDNRTSGGHWLEVDLVGPPGNRSAIGALVTIGGALSQVGTTSESSRFSQGHYRQYAGLGTATSVDVTVRWPDGTQTQLADVPADQQLRIAQ